MVEFLAGLAPYSAAFWSAVGGAFVLVLGKVFVSKREKHSDDREDFKAITDTLFKDIAKLREEIEHYRESSEASEQKYKELQTKLLDFKQKYNELELRYQVQTEINKKLIEEIKKLDAQIALCKEKEKQYIEKQDTLIRVEKEE